MTSDAGLDTMTTAQVARHLGLSRRAAGRWLRRHSITALGREPGTTGQNLYPAQLVRERARTGSPQACRYDRWRDERGTHIAVGARVTQSRVDARMGAPRSRHGQHGQVTGRGATRLLVRFEGQNQPVSIRPHLVRVVSHSPGPAEHHAPIAHER